MLCRKFELIPTKSFVVGIFLILKNTPCFYPKNAPQFLLHFLIHIDVLMLRKKFELFLKNKFRVMCIFFKMPISMKTTYSMLFLQKNGSKTPPVFITFTDHTHDFLIARTDSY